MMAILRKGVGLVAAAFLVSVGVFACRSQQCVPGQQTACACPGGTQGSQACNAEGSGFLPCECGAGGIVAEEPVPSPVPTAANGNPVPVPVGAASDNDGTNARKPVLPPEDVGLIDKRGGWEWNDRCWKNIQAGKLGYAKAECDRALAMKPKSPMPLAAVYYNLGLIEKGAGNVSGARAYFQKSLDLRENAEVRAAAASLPGGEKPCTPCYTQEDFDAAGKKGLACCAANRCKADASCSGGRVCCRIPNGALCTDSRRCAKVDRVDPKAR
ncbi:MAG: hypothetical protein R3B70_00865 [Polyangiaceae bacterium]